MQTRKFFRPVVTMDAYAHGKTGLLVSYKTKKIPVGIAIILVISSLTACGKNVEPSSRVQQASDPIEIGRKAFRQCAICHTVEKEASPRVGPNLYGIYGAQAGAREDFNYSRALRNASMTWDDTNLDAFIKRPSQLIPNNRMSFVGIADVDERAAIITYLKTLKDQGE